MIDTCVDIGTTAVEVTLVGVDGSRHDLLACSPPMTLTDGSTFRGMTPYAVSTRVLGPSIPGEQVTAVRAVPRTFTLPVIVAGNNEQTFDAAHGNLESILAPIQGPCRIIYRRADGTHREIVCHYIDGASNFEVHDFTRERHVVAPLVFRAHYPYWRAVETPEGTSTGHFSDGGFAGSNPLTVNNIGDVETWPVVTLTGPAENVEAINLTTGQYWRMTEVLATAANTVRIETDPRSRAVWLGDDFRPDILDPTAAELWPLVPGNNLIVLRAISPANAGTFDIRWPLLYGTC
jgi:hypothetical protein